MESDIEYLCIKCHGLPNMLVRFASNEFDTNQYLDTRIMLKEMKYE